MTRIIGNAKQFRRAALKALDIIAAPVKATLGPDGSSILIDREGADPLSTKDGVTVANSINVPDPVLNTLITAIKQAAQKTNEYAGDGTTTAIVLAEAVLREGLKYINTDIISSQKLAVQLKNLEPIVLQKLDEISTPIDSETDALHVAMISCNGDAEVAEKVMEAIDIAGRDGVIKLEEHDGRGIVIQKSEGYRIENGWGNHNAYGYAFIKDRANQETVLTNAYVLCYDGMLTDEQILTDKLKQLAEPSGGLAKNILIVAHGFSGQVRQLMAACASQMAPILLLETRIEGTENSKLLQMEDLSVVVGAKMIKGFETPKNSDGTDSPPLDLFTVLGRCDKIVQTKKETLFYDGAGTSEEVQKQVDVIKRQIQDLTNEHDRSKYRGRIGRLVGGLVIVKVGGTTPLETKERKDRVEDALNATRAAILEGIVPGGGISLLTIANKMDETNIGSQVLKDALKEPIKQIARNSGESPDVVANRVDWQNGGGFDARNLVYVTDMIKAGIVDPLRVAKTSFSNALSIAIEILKGGGFSVRLHQSQMSQSSMMPGVDPAEQFVTGLPGDNIADHWLDSAD